MRKRNTLNPRDIFRDFLQICGLYSTLYRQASGNNCPIGVLYPDLNICYWYREMQAFFSDQVTGCDSMYSGGKLAWIPNEDALKLINDTFSDKISILYGTFIGVKCPYAMVPNCIDPDGEPVTYLPWVGGLRTGNGECVGLYPGGFSDTVCENYHAAFCSLQLSNLTTSSPITTEKTTEMTTTEATTTEKPTTVQTTPEADDAYSTTIAVETNSQETTHDLLNNLGSQGCLCICEFRRNVSDSDRVHLMSKNILAFIQILSTSVYSVGDFLTCQNSTSCILPVEGSLYRSCSILVK